MSDRRIPIMDIADMVEGHPYRVVTDDGALVVVKVGDEVFALDDRCTHQKVSLSEGFVDRSDRVIECPRHGSQFSLDDGTALQLPATKPLRTHPVRVVDGVVEVLVF